MATLSCFDLWRWPLVVLVLAVLIFGRFRARTLLLAIALAVLLGDGIVSASLKHIVQRPRPFQVLPEVRVIDLQKTRKPRFLDVTLPPRIEISDPDIGLVLGNSFPSSHTVNNFSVAVVLACFYRRWGWLYFIPAALVSYSRIYVGVHWPTDVLTSVFIGIAVGLAAVAGLEAAWRRYGRQWWPVVFASHPVLIENALLK